MLTANHTTGPARAIEAIVVGASAGGVAALTRLLPRIGASGGPPVMVVVHLPARGGGVLAQIFGRLCSVPVQEARDKQAVARGAVYVAPPGYHLLVESDRHFALSVDDPVNGSRPSIDVLFESAAEVYRGTLAAIVLSGANSDGACGARAIRDEGGFIAAQDPAQAEAPQMPRAAIESADPQFVGSLDAIAECIRKRMQEAS